MTPTGSGVRRRREERHRSGDFQRESRGPQRREFRLRRRGFRDSNGGSPNHRSRWGRPEVIAEHENGMFVPQRVNPFEAFREGSERIPNVFFKMSRCSRRWRFSRSASSSWARRSEAAAVAPRRRSPPAAAGAEPSPCEEPIRTQAKLPGHDLRGLATGDPIPDRFKFEGGIVFATGFPLRLIQGLHASSGARFFLRLFGATSGVTPVEEPPVEKALHAEAIEDAVELEIPALGVTQIEQTRL